MDDRRAEQKAYVRAAMEATGLDATNLARNAGLSQTTLSRFLNAPNGKYLLSVRTLSAIAAVSGLPVPTEATGFVSTPPEILSESAEEAEKRSIAAEAYEILRRLPRSEQLRYLEYLRVDLKRKEEDH